MLPLGFDYFLSSGQLLERVGDDWILTFGKHKGASIVEVPLSYLRFMVDSVFTTQQPTEELALFLELSADLGIYQET